MIPKNKRAARYFTYIEPVIRAPIVKTYGYLILTIIALIIFIIFAIKPTIQTILVLQKDLETQKEILVKITKKSQDLSLARKNYQNINPDIKDKIRTSIPPNTEVAVLIRALEDAALQAQASISALQFQPLTLEKQSNLISEQKLSKIDFTFNVEGSYNTVKQVLDNLKSSPRLITINTLIFNKVEGSQLLMSITGEALYLK